MLNGFLFYFSVAWCLVGFPAKGSGLEICWQTFLILPTCVGCLILSKEEEEEKEEEKKEEKKKEEEWENGGKGVTRGCCT